MSIRSESESTKSSFIDIEFSDKTFHKNLIFQNKLNLSMGTMNIQGTPPPITPRRIPSLKRPANSLIRRIRGRRNRRKLQNLLALLQAIQLQNWSLRLGNPTPRRRGISQFHISSTPKQSQSETNGWPPRQTSTKLGFSTYPESSNSA